MLKIKLFPKGKKHQLSYRLVVAEARSKNNGRYVEDIGFYTPQTKTLKIDQPKFDQWLKKGATPTLGISRLLHPEKFPRKSKKTTPTNP